MFISIDTLLKNNNYCFSKQISFWFEKDRYEFYTTEKLREFGYNTSDQEKLKVLLADNNIIPSFSVDEYEFDRMYVDSFRNKKLSEMFDKIKDREQYDHAFRVYTENNIYYGYKLREFTEEAAVKWCVDNNIKYRK